MLIPWWICYETYGQQEIDNLNELDNLINQSKIISFSPSDNLTLLLLVHVGTLYLDYSVYNTFTFPLCHLKKTILSTREGETTMSSSHLSRIFNTMPKSIFSFGYLSSPKGLVKISPSCWSVDTYWIFISPSYTFYHMKWYFISIG